MGKYDELVGRIGQYARTHGMLTDADRAWFKEAYAELAAMKARGDRLAEALGAVKAAQLNGGDGAEADYGWNITRLNRARPLIRQALTEWRDQ